MLSLNDRTWKAFKLIDLFEYNRGNQNKMNSLTDGYYPLVSAKNIDNGLKAFVKENDKSIYDGNSMSLNNDGDGGVGIAYYQPHDYYLDSHCTALYPKNTKSRLVMLFLCASTTKQRSLFSHGYSISEKRLKKIMIMLPIADDGQPDYAFMEQYIRELEDKLKQKYIDFVNAELETPPIPLAEKEWKEFSIADIFDIKAGKRLTTADMDSGNLPFIGATELNNGITNWINTPNETLDHNVLGVNYNGSVAEAIYHPYSCVFSDDVKRLHLKNADDGKYILLFCSMLIRKQKVKYTYGYKFNGNRMARQKILLPITDDGQPDYKYMTQYAKAIMFGKYKKYLEYQKCPIL